MERELDRERRKGREALQQAAMAEQERVTELQWDVEGARAAVEAAREALEKETVRWRVLLCLCICRVGVLRSCGVKCCASAPRTQSLKVNKSTLSMRRAVCHSLLRHEVAGIHFSETAGA